LSFFILLQFIYGAFTAGLKAGYLFNTYPLMGGEWIPPVSTLSSFIFEPAVVQWFHRCLGTLLGCWAIWTVIKFIFNEFIVVDKVDKKKSQGFFKSSALILAIFILCQSILGIATLLLVVPIPLAAVHQLLGLTILFELTLLHYRTNKRFIRV
jgi:cytochrome c oxidase assembly protein subunit 15